MRNQALTRSGMTAVEVLASTLLASLMFGSVVGVLGGLARQQRGLLDSPCSPSWHQQLAEQLRWDLENSREVVSTEYGVQLHGFAGRDFVNGQPTGRPTAVEYLLVEAGSGQALVRRESHLDARSNDNWRIELACFQVTSFDFGTTKVKQVASGVPHLHAPDQARPIPRSIAVRIYESAGDAAVFDRQFILR